ncbi:unnamed protein product [Orchesella dallaii]|uniref:Uncharacterized protein n=1 Tax=Orchesella dallaii TaxID=48710 RepID=A0ABP1RF64_9HEXA
MVTRSLSFIRLQYLSYRQMRPHPLDWHVISLPQSSSDEHSSMHRPGERASRCKCSVVPVGIMGESWLSNSVISLGSCKASTGFGTKSTATIIRRPEAATVIPYFMAAKLL